MNGFRLEVIIELTLAVVGFVYLKYEMKRFRKEMDGLKRDADNFGSILGTTRARARLLKHRGDKK